MRKENETLKEELRKEIKEIKEMEGGAKEAEKVDTEDGTRIKSEYTEVMKINTILEDK